MTTTSRNTPERSYGQFCPIAVGLDIIGDRWTLLMLRELSMGDRRFTDLRAALPGIAPNLLTERLHSLQAADLVATIDLPPPAARSVYRLTDEGHRIEPVLRAVARFGSRYLSGEPSDGFDASRAAYALLAPWRRRPAEAIRARFVLTRNETEEPEEVDLVLEVNGMRVVPPQPKPDVTLRVAITDLVAARQTGDPLLGNLSGRAGARRVFLEQFGLRMATSPH
jgi:DNA-binding HxlR family transcriptional regulator